LLEYTYPDPRGFALRKQNRHQRSFLLPGVLIVGAVLFGIVLFASGILASQPSGGISSEISASTARSEMQNGALLLDVREGAEYASFHVPDSQWIPLGDLPSRLNELPRNRLIILMCRTGVRSANGRDILVKAGFPRVTSISGGIEAWMSAGYPVEQNP
jgi:rhodanese-related sulfurtransferase